MCAAELDRLRLTAGGDVDALQPPLVLDRSMADERFVGLGAGSSVVRWGHVDARPGRHHLSGRARVRPAHPEWPPTRAEQWSSAEPPRGAPCRGRLPARG